MPHFGPISRKNKNIVLLLCQIISYKMNPSSVIGREDELATISRLYKQRK
jgi:hypothetical protein